MARLGFARALLFSALLIGVVSISASTLQGVSSAAAASRDELLRQRHPDFGQACADLVRARPASQQRNVDCVTVYFGASRAFPAQITRTTDLGVIEGQTLALGRADVWLPRLSPNGRPRPRGDLEQAPGDLSGKPLRQQFYVYVTRIGVDGEQAFYSELSGALRRHPNQEKSALLFVHGYNVTFDEALTRAAQISVDLTHEDFNPGVPMLFSWPSAGETTQYLEDGGRAHNAPRFLADFIEGVVSRPGEPVEVINIVAHSMGNRVLAEALRIYGRRPRTRTVEFRIVSAAGDIARDAYTERARSFDGVLRPRVTIYASEDDAALAGSQVLSIFDSDYARRGLRLGQVRDRQPYVRTGYTSIDASRVTDTFVGFGHGYYADNASILFDARCALAGRPVGSRALLARGSGSNLHYVAQPNSNPPVGYCKLERASFPADIPRVCQAETLVVYFEPNAQRLGQSGLETLDAVQQRSEGCLVNRVELVGHADAEGSPEHNVVLSERRAEDVRGQLIARGVESENMVALGRGESDLARPTRDGASEALNRRVEIRIIYE